MDEEKGMSKEQITNKVQEVAEILLKNAPKNEKILFDKIMRSDDVKLMKEFGKTQEELANMFLVKWSRES